MTNWIVGPRHDAVNALAAVSPRNGAGTIYGDVGGVRLWPVLLTDGNYALPAQVATDATYAAAHPFLSSWTTQSSVTAVQIVEDFQWRLHVVNGARLLHARGIHPGALAMPASNVFKFDLRRGERFADSDFTASVGTLRRATMTNAGTLAAPGNTLYEFGGTGESFWISFSWVLGTLSSPKVYSGTRNADTLIFSSRGDVQGGVRYEPGISVFYEQTPGIIAVYTSSTSTGAGTNVLRGSIELPEPGEVTHMVFQVTTGVNGHLNGWFNGVQRIDIDVPIGHNIHTNKKLGLQIGPYTFDSPDPTVTYYANLEYGPDSLAARTNNPLSVPDLDW